MGTPDTAALGTAAARGAGVTVASQGGKLLILLASTAVLSRLLTPADFGLLAVVLSVVALGELLRDLGLPLAAVQAVSLSRQQRVNLVWMNGLLGVLCAIVLVLVAPALAGLFSDPRLTDVLRAVAPVFVVSGFSAQFRAEITRSMRFGRLALIELIPAATGLVVAVVAAAWTGSYWALVLQQLAAAIVAAALSTAWGGFALGLPRRAPMRELVSFGAGLMGTQVLAYAAKNADTILIGAVLGARPLGLYSRAYQLVMAPLTQVQAPLTRVAVPVLARAWPDRATFSRFLVRGQLYGGIVVAVGYCALAGLSEQVVGILLGSQWSGSVPIFAALCIGGVFRALAQVNFWSFVASGRTTSQLRLYLVTQPLIVALMAVGLIYGVVGVAVGHALGYLISWLLGTVWAGRSLEIGSRALLRPAATHLLVWCLPVLVATAAVARWLPGTWVPLGAGVLAALAVLALGAAVVPQVRASVRTGFADVRRLRRRGPAVIT